MSRKRSSISGFVSQVRLGMRPSESSDSLEWPGDEPRTTGLLEKVEDLDALERMTQAEILAQSGTRPVLLLDDLVSEFDEQHFQAVLARAGASGAQLWLTGTQRPELPPDHLVFHVEQGRVTELV